MPKKNTTRTQAQKEPPGKTAYFAHIHKKGVPMWTAKTASPDKDAALREAQTTLARMPNAATLTADVKVTVSKK